MRLFMVLILGLLMLTPGRSQFAPQKDTNIYKGIFKRNPFPAATVRNYNFDTATIRMRPFTTGSINTYRNDPQFQYDRSVELPPSWWARFWNWFWFRVSQLFTTPEGRNTVWTVLTLVAVAVIIYFLTKVAGMNKTSLFGKRSGGLRYSTSEENIHAIQFDEAIENAIAQGNLRQALRLLYLKALKKLSDDNYISWQINKTNTDYLKETSAKPWFSLFRTLTYGFEYAWYGEVPLDKERFSQLHQQFRELHNQL